MAAKLLLTMIYVHSIVKIIKSQESTTTKPLDPGPESFRLSLPPPSLNLPPPGSQVKPRNQGDLETFENALNSLPGQPIRIRKKFSNANPVSSEIAKASRAQEWSKLFGFEATNAQCPVTQQSLKCNPRLPVRSPDGTCNNIQHPEWGARLTPFTRLMPAAYEDGHHDPRGAVYTDSGYISRLPSPRVVSSNMMLGSNTSDSIHSHALMEFGQFLDHDITANSKQDYECCNQQIAFQPKCFNIDIKGDLFYGAINRTCMDFSRSNTHCLGTKPWAEQFNEATAFIDGSQIYGSTIEDQKALRKGQDGLLATHSTLNEFLPSKKDLGMSVGDGEDLEDFVAGDGRAMSQPTLLSFHVLWLREHNRIASRLKTALTTALDQYSDQAKDEVLFQESRKLVIAQLQNIVYNHFLPEILAPSILDKFGLQIASDSTYYPEANPTVKNEFSAAANRYGHSQVQDVFQGKDQPWRLGMFFGDPKFAVGENGEGFEKELAGVVVQNSLKVDRFVCKELINNLYNSKKEGKEKGINIKGHGHDLVAINVQRGRDHGLPGYNAYRKLFGLTSIASMDGKPDEMEDDAWETFKMVFREPQDIDLYPGGLSEKPLEGGLLGHSFSYIIADQFKALKDGDRFFFTHSKGPEARGLNIEVQDMVMKRSFRDVICQNTKTIPELPKNVFLMNQQNMESCENVVELDFEKIVSIISGTSHGQIMASHHPESSTSIFTSPSDENPTNEVWSENSATESTSGSSIDYENTTSAAAAETLYEISTKEQSYENSTTETYKDIYI